MNDRDQPILWAGAVEAQLRIKDLRFAMVHHLDMLMEGHKQVGAQAIDAAIAEINWPEAFRREARSLVCETIAEETRDGADALRAAAREAYHAWLASDAFQAVLAKEIESRIREAIHTYVRELTWDRLSSNAGIKSAVQAALSAQSVAPSGDDQRLAGDRPKGEA